MSEFSSDQKMHEGVRSCGLSTYGWNYRVSNEVKNLPMSTAPQSIQKPFVESAFVSVQFPAVIVPSDLLVLAKVIEHWNIPMELLTIYVGKSTCARCGIARERDAIRAGVGMIQSYSSTGQRFTPTNGNA